MKITLNKWTAIVISLFLIIGFIPTKCLNVNAEDNTHTDNQQVTYSYYDNNTAIVTGHTNEFSGEATIPSFIIIDDVTYTITSIGETI